MPDQHTISAHEAVERLLSVKLAEEPGFLAELMLDPAGAVAPLLAETTGKPVDLSGVSVNVHLETGRALHFVVPVLPNDDDVDGFSLIMPTVLTIPSGGWGTYRGQPCDLTTPRVGGGKNDTVIRPTGHAAYCEPPG